MIILSRRDFLKSISVITAGTFLDLSGLKLDALAIKPDKQLWFLSISLDQIAPDYKGGPYFSLIDNYIVATFSDHNRSSSFYFHVCMPQGLGRITDFVMSYSADEVSQSVISLESKEMNKNCISPLVIHSTIPTTEDVSTIRFPLSYPYRDSELIRCRLTREAMSNRDRLCGNLYILSMGFMGVINPEQFVFRA